MATGKDRAEQAALAATSAPLIQRSVERATGEHPALPRHLADLLERPERFTVLPNAVAAIEGFIRERAGAETPGMETAL